MNERKQINQNESILRNSVCERFYGSAIAVHLPLIPLNAVPGISMQILGGIEMKYNTNIYIYIYINFNIRPDCIHRHGNC
jgi:hypothetical protein